VFENGLFSDRGSDDMLWIMVTPKGEKDWQGADSSLLKICSGEWFAINKKR